MTAFPRPFRETGPDVVYPLAPALPEGYEVHNGRLFQHGIDLMSLVQSPVVVDAHLERPVTPMYIRRLPALRDNFNNLYTWFQQAKAQVDYPGTLTVAFASKANPSEPVVKTLLMEGAAYECSSAYDVDIVRHAASQGWLDHSRTILANGFKIPQYARRLLQLRADGFAHVLPIFDDLEEIEPFAESDLTFEVGLRSRTDSDQLNRFGLSMDDMFDAAEWIASTDNLRLTTFHAMQTVSASRWLQYQAALAHSVRQYAALRRRVPTLHRFNFGGGLPCSTSGLNFQDWMNQTLANILNICAEEGVPAPDLIIESGRYLVQSHAAKLFRIVKTRIGEDGIPYYMVDGSIMSAFPDAWALGDKFTVLPINGWDGPFGPARLAGLTCDHDDVYPTRSMDDHPLMLPMNADGLIVGFFDCGAYQETLGGRRGAKHCLLPEGSDMIVDHDAELEGDYCTQYILPQTGYDVLHSLGYAL